MNPQKNQGAEDSPLLRDLQAEVSSESAPMLQFMLRHAGTIASIVVLFVLVLAGTGIWRWYSTSKNDEARQSLARIVLQTSGPAQVKELAALAEKAPTDVRFSTYLALGQSAMSNGDTATAASATVESPKPNGSCRQRTKTTANTPLSASPSSVKAAAFFLPLRKTLVAPGLPEP